MVMDVCNEILDNNGNLYNLPFKQVLGDNWYEEVFQMAKKYHDQYAPQMFLFSHIPCKVLQKNLECFTAVGLKVALTKINIQRCVSVTSWGLTPADSWVGFTKDPGQGDATLFEDDFSTTPAIKLFIKKGFFP
ncbi:hypothetical protein PGTUg99_005307 [Puccinia graminis f. sp. tritici]|nr:hypothetical protein PGTUg99_005307 [Puccinia graminis f. sp. tritici]